LIEFYLVLIQRKNRTMADGEAPPAAVAALEIEEKATEQLAVSEEAPAAVQEADKKDNADASLIAAANADAGAPAPALAAPAAPAAEAPPAPAAAEKEPKAAAEEKPAEEAAAPAPPAAAAAAEQEEKEEGKKDEQPAAAAPAAAPATTTTTSEPSPPKPGVVVFAGGTDWAMIGRQGGAASKKAAPEEKEAEAERASRYPSLTTPVRLAALDSVPVSFVAAGPSAMHCLACATDGRLFTWGRNEKGQLGHGDLRQRNVPSVVGVGSLLANRRVVAAAGGKSHSLVVVEGGEAFAFGSNTHGQLGTGSIRIATPAAASASAPSAAVAAVVVAGEDIQARPVRSQVSGISSVATGADFSAWLNGTTGALYTAGHPQYGVLGHGTDHEYNAKDSSVKLMYAPQPTPKVVQALSTVKIRAVAAGTQHMLGESFDGVAEVLDFI